ncbi:SDR family NAD(P)-dependent oxidoreductase [Fodinicurvata sediminis]|uniref:SDR family NAD(P)-dependent oxidoreductase n=1 Tax=Fodinicurvata sediminis TaxID=1121832 RepID=UPI0003B2EC2A|nr:SDR family NAD(P)-dependent oxidoreductase [Fodinicurvata sediminis]
MLERAGAVALISGASRGIGAAIARKLLSDGWRVSLGARTPTDLDQVAQASETVLHSRYDAEAAGSDQAWIEETLSQWGRIDAVVNNAGVVLPFTVEDADEANLDRTFEINVKAPLRLARLALPHLRNSSAGRIINISSLSGKRVKNDNVAYAMSKHAVVAMTHALRKAGWDDGVRASVICPSFVRTDLTSEVTKIAQDDMTSPEDLAELVGTVLRLPNEANVAELIVNCRCEDLY